MKLRKIALAAAVSVGVVTLAVDIAAAQVVVQPSAPAPVVVQPAPPAQQVVQAEDIEANDVRAHTIYANKIKASQVNGRVHQTKNVDVSGKGDIKVPSLEASVIYAESIEARTVTATDIYVREIERR